MSHTGDNTANRPNLVTLSDIERAHKRVTAYVHRTPLLTSTLIDEIATNSINAFLKKDDVQSNTPPVRVRLAFKSEHLQKVGAFKMRGATNAVQTYLEQSTANATFDASKLCVITHSSGNHAAAVACAARSVGAKAVVVMPRTAPQVKKDAVAGYGAQIHECEPTQKAREALANSLMDSLQKENSERIVRFIHPYDDELVIAGQGTLALEMWQQVHALEQTKRGCSEAQSVAGTPRDDGSRWKERDAKQEPVLDIVVAPVGGGGMLSGVSTAIKGKDERIQVIAAEPKEADDAARTFQSDTLQPAITPPRTICDGLLTALSPFTYKHIKKNVSTILTATEAQIKDALQLIWTRMKQFIEPSAAVGLAIILHNPEVAKQIGKIAQEKTKNNATQEPVEIRIGVVWTGGNVELASIAKLFANDE
ncbi:tryptophan synthase beta subunit-like PLP-dependent enzyme [Meira miltonrushii]|uniref:Serine racemase n=1 Tax=Meira miltonrushii TaxID=1280837 RepID=A0A316V873_9BASI|nr:tryptophan synthase beta subunit-like PLP-dependent enzyme [Meira miltonrushii]PWN33696.1 tryptophan synthase beta subunit-like PLP-dependent enzyme [Meira miltonrushii]